MVVSNNRAICRWIPAWKSNIVLFFWGIPLCVFFTTSDKSHTNCCFRFQLQLFELADEFRSINFRSKLTRSCLKYANLPCECVSIFPGSDNQRHNNNSFTISIYLLPSDFFMFFLEESDRKSKTKMMSQSGNWGRCLARNLLWLYFWWYWI